MFYYHCKFHLYTCRYNLSLKNLICKDYNLTTIVDSLRQVTLLLYEACFLATLWDRFLCCYIRNLPQRVAKKHASYSSKETCLKECRFLCCYMRQVSLLLFEAGFFASIWGMFLCYSLRQVSLLLYETGFFAAIWGRFLCCYMRQVSLLLFEAGF
jgi:hypothetical protein